MTGCLLATIPTNAQLFQWGVKGGVNMSRISWSGNTYLENKKNATGFFIGPMAELTIPLLGLGVDGAVMYAKRATEEWEQRGIDIPLHLKYTFGLGSILGVYVLAGPDFFFNFKDIDWDGVEKEKRQIALDVGAGLKLFKHMQFGITYQIPLRNSFYETDNISSASKTKTWQVSLAYLF